MAAGHQDSALAVADHVQLQLSGAVHADRPEPQQSFSHLQPARGVAQQFHALFAEIRVQATPALVQANLALAGCVATV